MRRITERIFLSLIVVDTVKNSWKDREKIQRLETGNENQRSGISVSMVRNESATVRPLITHEIIWTKLL